MKIERKDINRKPCIGIMLGNYHSDHPRQLLRIMYGLLSSEEVDVRFYLGTESSSFLTDFGVNSNSYDYQYASFYSMSRYDDLDLLIVSIGTLSIYHDWISTDELMASLPKVPVIILENEKEVEDGIWLIADNYQGSSGCVEHLISEHGLKNILFITGPRGNFDSDERLRGYLDAMKRHGLEVKGSMIAHGDFSENVDDEVERLLDSNPGAEAIVSANDEMAYAIYRVCEKRGLEIGKDIAATGFDDAEMSKYLRPPLTTCRQDCDELSRRAVQKAMSLLRGEEVFSERLPSPLIVRGSCGCQDQGGSDNASLDGKDIGAMLKARMDRADFRHDVWKSALLMREMISETADMKEFMSSIGRFLSSINVSRSYFSLYEHPREVERGEVSTVKDSVRLFLVQERADIRAFGMDDAPALSGRDDPVIHELVHPGYYITFLLYYEKYQYGVMSVEIEPSRIDFFYVLSLELGTSFRHLQMAVERERYRAELQAIARHDNLTGLFNRLGLAGTAAGYISVNKDRRIAAMMADLDHLKQINDTFGHRAGDTAIIKSASILRSALGKHAPLGRTGGDEFMGIFAIRSEKDIERVERKIHDACDKYNAKSDNPFYVEISAGFHIFRAEEFKDLTSIMEPADQNLYEAKKHRRESVIR